MFELSIGDNLVTTIDDEDVWNVIQHSWHPAKSGKNVYVRASVRCSDGTRRSVPLHRFLMNPPAHLYVDHKDGNTLNNCRSNLRICTPRQNSQNVPPRNSRHAKSKYKGVRWDYPHKKWSVTVIVDGRRIHGGYFDDEIEAARRHDELARFHIGDFAWCNFPAPWREYLTM